MKAKYLYLSIVIVTLMFLGACNTTSSKQETAQTDYKHFVKDQFEQIRNKVPKNQQGIFDVFKQDLTPEEKEAMQFLYAFMPLSDLSNRSGDFYLSQVRSAFEARKAFTWGKSIPESVFRHFVLPYRINNENSDESRALFFKELYPRIKDMTMEEAALEVNHWCHEKVNYRPTNERTISPQGAIKTAYGRCGEESTFTVTALRSVSIPARQVYTPRWAHTDDNHAWVEVFIDGQWKYLGACEPKPVLNTAWFDEPVLRAMMVHTKAFGKYNGSEAVIHSYDQYSILNLLSNYVPVKTLVVKVVNQEKKPVADASVSFGLYNYAEFYALKKYQTDEKGMVQMTSGLGTLEVMASSKNGMFNSQMVDLSEQDTCVIVLEKKIGTTYQEHIAHIPPVQRLPKAVSSEKVAENDRRLLQEDSIREQYIATFYTDKKAQDFLKSLALSGSEKASLIDLLKEARGNYAEVEKYLNQAFKINKEQAVDLLSILKKKDLHDLNADVIIQHLKAFKCQNPKEKQAIIKEYVLNPRVSVEEISDYRPFLQEQFADIQAQSGDKIEKAADLLQKWVETHITIDDKWNYYRIIMNQKGVYNLRVADKRSRDVFFVSVMRSLGFPARIEQARRQLQYYHNNQWVDVIWNDKNATEMTEKPSTERAKLSFKYQQVGDLKDPLYRIHFGLAKYNGSTFETLEYDWEKPLSAFEMPLEVEPGYYQLITGNRLHDGRVLIHRTYFNLKANENKVVDLIISEVEQPLPVLAQWTDFKFDKKVKDNYEIIGWINPKTEPGKHFINDFKPLIASYKEQNIPFKLYTSNPLEQAMTQEMLGNDIMVSVDKSNALLEQLYQSGGFEKPIMLPVFIIIDRDKNIRLLTKGYNIGTPAQLLKYANLLK